MMDTLLHYALFPFQRMVEIGDPFNAPSLLGAVLFAAACYVVPRWRRAPRRLRALLRSGFPRRIIAHPSAKLDYRLFFASSMVYATGTLASLISAEAVIITVRDGLTDHLGARASSGDPGNLAAVVVTLSSVLALDLGYWMAHWMMHRLPLLWEFHKVHHSAEVLTPFVEYRLHPVEIIFFPLVSTVVLGTVDGTALYLFGPDVRELHLLGLNGLYLVFTFTTLHLRHTHLWIAARGWLGHLIQSPAHHQIHHSTDPAHFGKNLGLFLSVWDWAFGTLYIPAARREPITFGIGEEGRAHHSVLSVWLDPLVKAGRRLWPRRALAPDAK